MDPNVFTFLQKYSVHKGSDHTHTSFVKPTGAFYVPVSAQEDFIDVYKRCMAAGDMLYVTEKHRDICPLLIDLDFRFEKGSTPPQRKYTRDDVLIIVKTYLDILDKYVIIPDEMEVFVMEKPAPVVDKSIVKDGIHIVIPEIITKPELQHIVRKEAIAILSTQFDHLELKNSWNDVIDEAIIDKNNWMMYGSRKPNGQPYMIKYIFDKKLEEKKIEEDHTQYVDILSIRNKFDETEVKPEYEAVEQAYLMDVKAKKPKFENSSIFQSHQNIKKNTVNDLEFVKKLVDILDIDRADNYQKWIRLGWCLRNIDHRLLETWIDFSKRSSKFEDGQCERIWNYMKDDGLNVGSLHLWAKEDNPDRYKDLAKNDLFSIVAKSVTGTHTDIARVVYFMYKYEYVCVSIKNNLWYEFKNHRWQTCDSGHSLRAKVSNEVCQEYYHQASIWALKAAAEADEDNRKSIGEKVKKLNEIALKLKITSFKDNIIKECREIFYLEKFEEKLDSRCHLLAFENGVFDLESYEFREGRPEDYISFTTGINYLPYDENEYIADIIDFMTKVFPKEHMKEYFLLLLSSFLNGNIREERFHIFTGGGCFAKDTKIMMFDGSDKFVQDVKVGDKLMGDDSTPRTVQQLFTGYSDMYEIKPIKGQPFIVNGEHKLVLKMSNTMFERSIKDNRKCLKWMEYDQDQIIISKSKTFGSNDTFENFKNKLLENESLVKKDDVVKLTVHQYLSLPQYIKNFMNWFRADSVEFEEKEVKLDPWVLGYWIGDGNSYDPAFTTEDIEVVEYFKTYCDDYDCQMAIYANKGNANTYGVSGQVMGVNKLRDGLNHYKLFKNKHIPDEFKYNSKDIRMQVLAGIVDSDGHYQKKMKQIEITQKSERVIDDIIWIARSLGFACYKSKIKKTCCNNGKVGDYFQTILVGDNQHELPVKIPRKKPEPRSCTRDPLKVSFKVKRVEDDNFYGFELDGNHLFLGGGGDFSTLSNSNGKSKCIELFESTLGDYCCKLPITLLTQKRAASNAATSELARTKGKRFACLQEPSEDEKLNVGLMKELTGGDKIMARQIYKEPIEFKPQFKMVLTCNQLPNVPANDNGTWRRLRVIEFTSKFTDKPNPENENEFIADTDLSHKFVTWKESFMTLLIHYYKKYTENGIVEPEEVLACTKEYQRNNDVFLDFVEQEFERNDMAFTSSNQVTNCFKVWLKDNNLTHISLKKKEMGTNFGKIMGKTVSVSSIEGYKGWQFKNSALNMRDELDRNNG